MKICATVGAGTDVVDLANVDRGGVVKKVNNDVANSAVSAIYGFVDPKTGAYVLSVVAIKALHIALVYRKDVQKNVPFSNTTTADGDKKTMRTMEFDITKQNVETKTRKLGAKYSFELMEDYKNEFGENFEDKMVDYLTTTILTEIDSETIDMLATNAYWSDTWDAQMPMTWTKGLNDWYATVMPHINALSMKIFAQTHVGGASFIVCNPITAVVFQGMMQYEGTGNPVDTTMEIGTVKAGTLSNAYNVFISPLVEPGKIILGFKGNSPESTGAIYAPYIPVQLQPIAYAEGMPAVMARTRYWMGMIRPDYYATLKIDNLLQA